jgi:hypothetical protein
VCFVLAYYPDWDSGTRSIMSGPEACRCTAMEKQIKGNTNMTLLVFVCYAKLNTI